MPAHATVIPAEEAAGTHCAHCAEVTGQEEGGAARPSSVRTREATKRLLPHGHRRSLPRAACGTRPGCGQGRWPAASAEQKAEPGQGTARREGGRGIGHRLEPLLQQAAARRAPRLLPPADGDTRASAANTERSGGRAGPAWAPGEPPLHGPTTAPLLPAPVPRPRAGTDTVTHGREDESPRPRGPPTFPSPQGSTSPAPHPASGHGPFSP